MSLLKQKGDDGLTQTHLPVTGRARRGMRTGKPAEGVGPMAPVIDTLQDELHAFAKEHEHVHLRLRRANAVVDAVDASDLIDQLDFLEEQMHSKREQIKMLKQYTAAGGGGGRGRGIVAGGVKRPKGVIVVKDPRPKSAKVLRRAREVQRSLKGTDLEWL